jgi:hypothetical protein
MAGLAARDHAACHTARRQGLPLVLTMAGGYARRLEDLVAIQANTVGAALVAYA